MSSVQPTRSRGADEAAPRIPPKPGSRAAADAHDDAKDDLRIGGSPPQNGSAARTAPRSQPQQPQLQPRQRQQGQRPGVPSDAPVSDPRRDPAAFAAALAKGRKKLKAVKRGEAEVKEARRIRFENMFRYVPFPSTHLKL